MTAPRGSKPEAFMKKATIPKAMADRNWLSRRDRTAKREKKTTGSSMPATSACTKNIGVETRQAVTRTASTTPRKRRRMPVVRAAEPAASRNDARCQTKRVDSTDPVKRRRTANSVGMALTI